jgi:hypothetical protein
MELGKAKNILGLESIVTFPFALEIEKTQNNVMLKQM